jgi:hypothetical protein
MNDNEERESVQGEEGRVVRSRNTAPPFPFSPQEQEEKQEEVI